VAVNEPAPQGRGRGRGRGRGHGRGRGRGQGQAQVESAAEDSYTVDNDKTDSKTAPSTSQGRGVVGRKKAL
jgi:hypothetical protein